jgi:hypothetical protein
VLGEENELKFIHFHPVVAIPFVDILPFSFSCQIVQGENFKLKIGKDLSMRCRNKKKTTPRNSAA